MKICLNLFEKEKTILEERIKKLESQGSTCIIYGKKVFSDVETDWYLAKKKLMSIKGVNANASEYEEFYNFFENNIE